MMIQEEPDLDRIKVCPCCVEGLLAKRDDIPDQVVYHCEECRADFTPALLHEILVKEQRLLDLEAQLQFRSAARRMQLVLVVSLIVFTVTLLGTIVLALL